MARRISFLVKNMVLRRPQRLLALTFTNAAAAEMRERVAKEVERTKLNLIELGTVHSFCFQVLRAYGSHVGISGSFDILGDSESEKLFAPMFEELSSRVKVDKGLLGERYNEWIVQRVLKLRDDYMDFEFDREFQEIYQDYRNYCLEHHQVGYDQLLVLVKELFESCPSVLSLYRCAYSYVLVDEVQDTNPLQFAIISLLVFGAKETNSSQIPKVLPKVKTTNRQN